MLPNSLIPDLGPRPIDANSVHGLHVRIMMPHMYKKVKKFSFDTTCFISDNKTTNIDEIAISDRSELLVFNVNSTSSWLGAKDTALAWVNVRRY
jgi:hypothetical protein